LSVFSPFRLAEVPRKGERWKDEGDAGTRQGSNQRIQRAVVWRQERAKPDQQRCKQHMSFSADIVGWWSIRGAIIWCVECASRSALLRAHMPFSAGDYTTHMIHIDVTLDYLRNRAMAKVLSCVCLLELASLG